jgi:hypothetical protein
VRLIVGSLFPALPHVLVVSFQRGFELPRLVRIPYLV